jgi:hypothetical protein
MPRPLPIPLSIGTDICFTPRIRRLLTPNGVHSDRFPKKLLTRHELQDYRQRWGIPTLPVDNPTTNPTPEELGRQSVVEYLALLAEGFDVKKEPVSNKVNTQPASRKTEETSLRRLPEKQYAKAARFLAGR